MWGDVRAAADDRKKQIEQLKIELNGVGTKIGPDLTGSNLKNLDYLLENIVGPSASVGADFRTVVAVLEDGREVNGVVVA